MATISPMDSFPVGLNYLYCLVKDHAMDIADVTTMVDALISFAGHELSDLTLKDLRRLVYIFPKTYDNTPSDDRGTWDQVHDLIHDGLTRLAAADAPNDCHSGLSQLRDLESLAYIKIDVAKWHGICPITSGLSSCYSNVDAAIEDKKSTVSLLPPQAWFQDDQSYPGALPYDILDQAISTSIAVKEYSKRDIFQLIANALPPTYTPKKAPKASKKSRDAIYRDGQNLVVKLLADTFRMLALKDVEAVPVQMIDKKGTDTPVVLPEPVDDKVLLSTQTPIHVQQISEFNNDSEDDNTAISLQTTSLPQQSDDRNSDTNADDSPQLPVAELHAHHPNHQTHAQGLECMVEGVQTQEAARSHNDLYPMPPGLNCDDIVDRSEERHQDVIHRFNRLESFLSDNDAKKQMIKDLQAKNALLLTELADEKAAHTQSKKCSATAERNCESARRDSAHQVKQLRDCLDTAKLNTESMASTMEEARRFICLLRIEDPHLEAKLQYVNLTLRLNYASIGRWTGKLRLQLKELDEPKCQALTDHAKSESDKKLSGDRVCVLMDRVDSLAMEMAEEKQAHQEARINAESDAHWWKTKIKDLQTQLEAAQIERMDMRLRLENLEASKDSLEEALIANENTIEALQGWSDSDHCAKTAMTLHVEALEVDVAGLKEALAAKGKAHEDLQATLGAFRSDQKDLIAAHTEEKAGLTETLTAKERAYQQCHKVKTGFEVDNEIFKTSLATEKRKCHELQDRFNFVEFSKEALAILSENLTCKIADLEKSLAISQATNTELSKQFDDVCREKEALNTKNTMLETEQKTLKKALATKQKDLNETKTNSASYKIAKDKYWLMLKADSTEKHRLRNRYHTEHKARKESDIKLQRANAVIHQHDRWATLLKTANNTINSALQRCRLALADEKETHNETKDNLSDTLDLWFSETKALEASLTAALAKVAKLAEANAELEAVNASLCAKLDAADKIGVEAAVSAKDAEDNETTAEEDDDAESWVELQDVDDRMRMWGLQMVCEERG